MIDPAFLDRAVARGIVSRAQADALAGLAADGGPGILEDVRDDERLRFITGFADIFVSIGALLFLGAVTYVGSDLLGGSAGAALCAALAWGLAEFFTRRRRMALPSIVLLAVFAASAFRAVAIGLLGEGGLGEIWARSGGLPAHSANGALSLAAAALVTLILVALHYRRFGVPITVAAGSAALAGTVAASIAAAAPAFAEARWQGIMVVAGLAVFALAMRFDLADPPRITRRTDIAFWLHLLAAPLIVHPVLTTILAGSMGAPSAGAAVMVLAVVLGLAVVALVTDRRAILVSGLVYAALAFGTLIHEVGFTTRTVPLSILALGGFILLLSAGWHPLRKRLLGALPSPWAARLPHPIGA